MKNAKKFFGLALVLCMLLSLAPTAVYAENTENLLQNGGFETAEENVATGWDYESAVKTNMVSVAGKNAFIVTKDTEGAYVHSGNNALKLVSGTSSENLGRWISQKVENITPGKAYRASAWVYIDGTLDVGLSLRISDTKGISSSACLASSSGPDRDNSYVLKTTDGWKNLSCVFVPSVKKNTDGEVTYDATFAHINVQFGYQTSLEKSVDVYVDDIVFEEISGINGSFENTEYTVSGNDASKVWATGWSTTNGAESYVTWIGEHAYVEANAGQNGSKALCLTTTEETARQLHAYVPVTGLKVGHAYKVRCYVKSSLSKSAKNVSINIAGSTDLQKFLQRLSWGGGAAAIIAKNTSVTPTNLWQESTVVFQATDTYAFIGLAATPAKDECIYFDDVTIEETSVCFTDESGISLGETLSAPGTVHAKATVIGAQGDTARMLVGVYKTVSGMPCLVNLYISDSITLPAAKYNDVTIENISLAEGEYAKAVLLDSTAGLQPLTETKMLTVSAS